jgi:uncharacterized membrane protein
MLTCCTVYPLWLPILAPDNVERSMEEWLQIIAKGTVVTIEAMALIIIVIAAVEAFFVGLWTAFVLPMGNRRVRITWLRFDRWLVAALTFLLAADIVGTSIAPTWQEIGRVGAIAVIRTFLNYFLGRDMDELRAGTTESG